MRAIEVVEELLQCLPMVAKLVVRLLQCRVGGKCYLRLLRHQKLDQEHQMTWSELDEQARESERLDFRMH